MSNTLTTIDMVAKEALRIAHEKATFVGTISRDYDDSFAKTGAKIGSTLRVRNPNQFTRRQGSRIMDVQDVTETTQTITVATQDGVDMRFNSAELALSLDELSQRYIEPAVSVLVSGIDSDALTLATQQTYNLVGTHGTPVGSSSGDITALGAARAKLNFGLAPMDNRSLQVDSFTMMYLSSAMKSLFLPTETVRTAFLDGFVGHTALCDIYENERTYAHTWGSDLTVNTSSSSGTTDGGTTVTMNSTDGNINKGDTFTLPKVFMCHPETKKNTGQLMQFVATAASTGAITVSPTIYWSGPRQNVCNATGGASVVADFDSETMTFGGVTPAGAANAATASTAYRNNLMYHKEAYTFVTADLPIMDDAAKCVRITKDGLSLRVWQASDIRNDELLMRIDILWGFKTLRPEWACRITN